VLFDDRGMVVTLMKGRTADYPATFHIGFIQATEADVDAMHARLTADGFAADSPARSHAYTFYVKAPGGFVVEVLC
jgi:lactoylglutathione lyase